MDLNLDEQYKAMEDKLNEACALFYSRQKRLISPHEAIHYVNSDLVSNSDIACTSHSLHKKESQKLRNSPCQNGKAAGRPCKINPHKLVD
jgi:hypothetical protein